jgi:hypothetical protein
MLLRSGNAGSNTVADHLTVLHEAIAQIPADFRAKILIDGAGATHELLEAIGALNTTRRMVRLLGGRDARLYLSDLRSRLFRVVFAAGRMSRLGAVRQRGGG